VEFKIKHMMITNVKGQSSDISGTIIVDESDITKSSVDSSVEANSINTRNSDRDAHLKSPDFFDVEKFPKLTFTSTAVTRTGDGELEVDGDFAIRGITRKVTFTVEGPTAPKKIRGATRASGWRRRRKSSAATSVFCGIRRWRPAVFWSVKRSPLPLTYKQ
jgi:polyisoprenoid-binding protein YceI